MKLSTRARYGLRAMVELARTPEGATGRNIAERQELPPAYLEQLMARLRNAQLVISIRGAKGKFKLARAPETIQLAEIVEALEGPIEVADCTEMSYCCSTPELCVLHDVYAGLNEAIHHYLAAILLSELARRQEQQENRYTHDYSI